MKDFLYKIRTKITRWMYGRNGQDEFSDACYMAGVVLLVVGMIFRSVWIYLPALVICGYSIFRTTSKNLIRRQGENVWFLQKTDKVKKFFDLQKRRWRDRKKSCYYRCKGCRQMIRVPKGHGKIEITCPKCGNKFIRKT